MTTAEVKNIIKQLNLDYMLNETLTRDYLAKITENYLTKKIISPEQSNQLCLRMYVNEKYCKIHLTFLNEDFPFICGSEFNHPSCLENADAHDWALIQVKSADLTMTRLEELGLSPRMRRSDMSDYGDFAYLYTTIEIRGGNL